MITLPDSIEIFLENDQMVLHIEDHVYPVSLIGLSEKLLNATDLERSLYKISPSGYGIHWPLLDEDLSIHSLLKYPSAKPFFSA